MSSWVQLPEPCDCDNPSTFNCNHVEELHVDQITFGGVNFRGRFLIPSDGMMHFHRSLEIDTALWDATRTIRAEHRVDEVFPMRVHPGENIFKYAVHTVFHGRGYENVPEELIHESWLARSDEYCEKVHRFAYIEALCQESTGVVRGLRRRFGDSGGTLLRFSRVCIHVGTWPMTPEEEADGYDRSRAELERIERRMRW